MGSLCTKEKWEWTAGWEGCLGKGEKVEDDDRLILERTMRVLEQKVHDLDEANHRLYEKSNTAEERFHQQQGETRDLLVRCQNLERRIDLLVFEHCERLDDDIIVMDES